MKYKRIEHVAIAVKNLDAVRDTLAGIGIACDYEETLPGPGVRLAMLPIGEFSAGVAGTAERDRPHRGMDP